MRNSIKMSTAWLLWRYTYAGVPYSAFIGMMLFLPAMITLDLLSLNISIPMIISGIVLIFLPMIFVGVKENLPIYVVEKISKLLVDKTETPPEDTNEKAYISALKDLLLIYVSGQKDEDFVGLKNAFNSYKEFISSV